MAENFYDVKNRESVEIDESAIKRTSYEGRNGQVRYAIRAKTADGRNLTRFVSKSDWDGKFGNLPVE
ncbi:MAG: hypothetical protein J4G17_01130 [Anaerolineae bacterium]|nr:hypothetical protein [Anaerolineae bacterium]